MHTGGPIRPGLRDNVASGISPVNPARDLIVTAKRKERRSPQVPDTTPSDTTPFDPVPSDAAPSDHYREGELIACPQCDALYRIVPLGHGERAKCVRCHTVLVATRDQAFIRVIALAVTVVILMVAATFFPFLSVSVAGLSNSSSVLDAALAFAGGPMFGLSLAVAALIVAIPIIRAALVVYVLTPLAFGRMPWPGAIPAFRFSETLRPWSMAEIFVIGVAVALVKVADLARIGFGPAFWMFAALVVVIVLKDGNMNRWTIWKALDPQNRS